MIYIKSDPDNKNALDEILDLVKSEFVWYSIEEFEKDWSRSILVYNTSKRPEKFKVILNWHLDVIPWKDFQYEPKIDWDKLYWVGSMDMKSNVACMMEVFKTVSWIVDYPLWLQIVTDEEIWGFNWTKHQVDSWVNADFVIAWETTNFNIVNKAKWIIWLKIRFNWVTAHWAYPWRWENAILKWFQEITNLLQKYPESKEWEWKTSVNLAFVETTNKTFNKIPDDFEISLDIRYIPEDKNKINNDIEELKKKYDVEIIANEPALFVEDDNFFVKMIQESVKDITNKSSLLYWANWSSDARHYMSIDSRWVEFWPIWWWIWTDEEWVSIESLKNFHNILEKFLVSLNNKKQ